MYARFFAKALNDLGLVHEREPWKRLFNQGQVLGDDGERMSKSRGNVQDPDKLVARYGADTVRLFLMFMKPGTADAPWNPKASRASAASCAACGRWLPIRPGARRATQESGRLPAGRLRQRRAAGLRRAAHRTLQEGDRRPR